MGMTTTRNEVEMSIKRMLLLCSMGLAAIAFAAPTAAQANVLLTDPSGTQLAKGAKVTATSTNLKTTTAAGTLECKLVTLHFEVTNPGTKEVVLKQLGVAGTEGCSVSGVAPVTITDGTIGVGAKNLLVIDTWGTSTTKATFESHIYADPEHKILERTCHFEGSVHVQATPSSPTDLLGVGPSVLTGKSIVGTCPATGTIHGEFTLETSNGVEVTLDFVETL
jgi:hypothetical protein